jgi:hypothetical protein
MNIFLQDLSVYTYVHNIFILMFYNKGTVIIDYWKLSETKKGLITMAFELFIRKVKETVGTGIEWDTSTFGTC